jgi:hypothetical protein
MHQIIVEGLEQYLGGADPNDPAQREFRAHLARCEACRLEVQEAQELSGLFAALRPAEEIQPTPGFYAGLVKQINEQSGASLWRMFSLDPLFGRRLAFACLTLLAVLGSFLVSQDSYGYLPENPEAVMAIEQSASPVELPAARDRGMMLVTLASYDEP